MDITCSPHRSSGGTLHLPSPTHPHRYRIDAFPSIKQLRRSLSRSPSKPSRFSLPAHSPESPRSPISPLALNRAFTPRAMVDRQHQTQPVSPLGPQHHTPIAPCSTTKRPKFTLRRTQPLRSSPRARANQNSVTPMRRALIESSNQANTHPVRRTCEDERADAYSQLTGKFEMEQKTPASQYLGFDDGPIKFGFSKSMTENVYPNEPPVKSSPLKRSDGIMNLDQASLGSPNPKRRSVHGASFGADFNVFDHGPNAAQSHTDVGASEETDREPLSFSSPAPKKSFTLRKSTSLRKATLQNRYPMPRANPETIATSAASASSGEFQLPLEAASKARQRMSLDSALGLGRTSADPLFRPNAFSQSLNGRPVSFAPQPHPLSKTLPNIPSSSNLIDDAVTSAVPPTPAPAQKTVLSFTPAKAEPNPFYRSLGPDAPRPMALRSKIAEGSPFETPMGTKIERGPAPFMSTGLISKQNRVVSPPGAHPVMPDTPSKLKRQSFPPMTGTPKRDSVAKTTRRPLPEFGTPSSPFNFHVSKSSAKSFGKGVPLFGSFSGKDSSRRRASFASIDGEDWQHSPSRHRESPSLPTDSQCSSNDELPPTPTKPSSRDNSLRSTLLGRRTSIAPDTFTAPSTALDVPSPTLAKGKSIFTTNIAGKTSANHFNPDLSSAPLSFARSRQLKQQRQQQKFPRCLPRLFFLPRSSSRIASVAKQSRLSTVSPAPCKDNLSPHTPQESFTPPDPSSLSISNNRRGSVSFGSSINFNASFPPATPSAHRESTFFFGASAMAANTSTQEDVDTALTSRFGSVISCGTGEFSQVYRTEKPFTSSFSRGSNKVFAVKKSKKPYLGARDRARKMQEVQVLQALKGHDHVIEYFDHWESKDHLYIQTEFCENGNLDDFLTQAGYKGRLDDFRIWKILLEVAAVSSGVDLSAVMRLMILCRA